MKDDCIDYYQAGRMQRTVHLHVMGRDELYRFNDITLVTQMTSERHDKLYRLAVRWTGESSHFDRNNFYPLLMFTVNNIIHTGRTLGYFATEHTKSFNNCTNKLKKP